MTDLMNPEWATIKVDLALLAISAVLTWIFWHARRFEETGTEGANEIHEATICSPVSEEDARDE